MLGPEPAVGGPPPKTKALGPVMGPAMVSVELAATWALAPISTPPKLVPVPRVMPRLALRVTVPELRRRKPKFMVNWLATRELGAAPRLLSAVIFTDRKSVV